MGYVKIFPTMYTGSMYGAGLHVFGVWTWALVHKDENGEVEINPELVAHQLGAVAQQVEEAIEYLCRPDPNSRSPNKEGRRLVKVSQFGYQVVNHEKYCAAGRDRSDYWREYRAKKRATVAQPSAQVAQPKITHADANANVNRRKRKTSSSLSEQSLRLAELLWTLIQARKPDFKEPDLRKWAHDVDCMIRLDKRNPERIGAVIRWAQADTVQCGTFPGWACVIVSTAKLRENFDKLEERMDQERSYGNGQTRRGGPDRIEDQDYGKLFDPMARDAD